MAKTKKNNHKRSISQQENQETQSDSINHHQNQVNKNDSKDNRDVKIDLNVSEHSRLEDRSVSKILINEDQKFVNESKKKFKKLFKDREQVENGEDGRRGDVEEEEEDLNEKLNSLKKISDGLEGMGEFEDAWEDEFEDEDSINLNDDDEDEDDEEDDDNIPGDGKVEDEDIDGNNNSRSPSPKTYLPHQITGIKTLGEDEELVADPTAYRMLHNLSLAWPALSFDVLRDDLGEERRKMPHSACIVAGTQAEARGDVDQDEIMIMKWEGLSKMARDPDYVDEDDDDEDDDDDDDDDGVDEDPILTYKTIPHKSSVNRVKAQALPLPLSSPPPRPPDHYFIASFSGAGKVHIFDIAPHLFALQSPQLANDQTTLSKRPYHTINQHGRAEGFALSWGPPPPSSTNQSSPSSLRLLSGDVCSKIYLTVSDQSGFTTQSKPFTSHTSSVEDIQWSPTEQTVFASCSADQSLKIWDVRVKDRRSVLGVQKAHPTDVNVLSWNLKTSYLIVSGGDEGGIKVWDLRNLQTNKSTTRLSSISGEEEPVAMFNWHKAPITSIEWHPTEDSCFISSSADDQVTIWDLSVEIDEEEERLRSKKMRSDGDDDLLIDQKIPPQLMFVHHGQSEIKEVHWHPQIPGTIISTALDGLNVFKTISV